MQETRLHCGVCEDIAQHCRHIGRDHARTFDDADKFDFLAADHGTGAGGFGESIGCADGVCRILPAARISFESGGNTRARLVFGQGHADHACGRDKHLLRFAADPLRDLLHDLLDRLAPAISSEGIGVSGIDDKRAGRAGFDLATAHFNLG